MIRFLFLFFLFFFFFFFFSDDASFALVDPRFNIGIFLKFLGAGIE